MNPLWNPGINGHAIDGTNQTIAIVGDSEICTQSSPDFNTCATDDVQDFRSLFGLSTTNLPTVILDGPDPGFNSDEIEGDLDVEWSGAIAKNATIDFVIAEGTEASAGTDLAAEYIVNNNLAPVLSESFSFCEAFLLANGNLFESALWEQAAAQGITVVVSTGDSGSAGCDDSNLQSTALNGANVNGIASTPFNVAVGGTDFDVSAAGYPSTFWSSTNTTSPNGIAGVSALSYIPETPWNDSCARTGASGCTGLSPQSSLLNIIAAGGGQSSCVDSISDAFGNISCIFGSFTNQSIPGWTKPAYQPVASGSGLSLFNDPTRDVPDISLFAGDGSTSNSFYIVCDFDLTGAPCGQQSQELINFAGVGGTSAGAPSFAAMMALVNQNMVVNHGVPAGQGQGNANYVLYPLFAAQQAVVPAISCTSASPNSACTFNDVVEGNNSVPCAGGSFNCSNPATGGIGIVETGIPTVTTPSYIAGTGYDAATGLGSVNAFNLVSNWFGTVGAFTPTTTTLCLSTTSNGCASSSSASSLPASIMHGTQVFVSIGVAGSSSTPPAATLAKSEDAALIGAPSGGATQPVDRFSGNELNGPQNVNFYSLGGGGKATGSTSALVGGTYTITARYGGDGTFGSSSSTPGIPITVTPESSTASPCILVVNPTTGPLTGQGVSLSPYSCIAGTTAPYGDLVFLRADVFGSSSKLQTATGNVTFLDGGVAGVPDPNGASATQFALNSEGYAEDQTPYLAVGSHSFSVKYTGTSGAGDASYTAMAVASTARSFSVTQAPTVTTLTSSHTSVAPNAPVTFTAFVDTQSGSNPGGGSFGLSPRVRSHSSRAARSWAHRWPCQP